MGVSSLPKTVTRQRRDCDLNPGPSAPESSALTTRLPSHVRRKIKELKSDGILRGLYASALFVLLCSRPPYSWDRWHYVFGLSVRLCVRSRAGTFSGRRLLVTACCYAVA